MSSDICRDRCVVEEGREDGRLSISSRFPGKEKAVAENELGW
jgi:hypothetical protein